MLDLGDGKFAIAAGDVHCTFDPMLGQGANLASYSAFILGEAHPSRALPSTRSSANASIGGV